MGVKAIVIRIWSAFLIFFYVAVFALGVVALVFVSVFPQIGVILMVFGFLGIFVAVSGCIGAGFQKKEKEKNHHAAVFLIIFFASMCFFHFVFMIFGVVLLCLANSIHMLELLPVGRFLEFKESTNWKGVNKGVADFVIQIAKKIRGLILTVGIVLVVVAVLHLATIIITAFRMGKTYVAKFFMMVCSLLNVALGLTLGIVVLLVSYSPSSMVHGQFPTYVVVPLIVFGFVLALIGVIGLISVCIGVKHKLLTVVFNVGNVIILAGFLFVFVVSIILYIKAIPTAETFCNDGKCTTWIDNANKNSCPDENDEDNEEPCYTINKMKEDFKILFKNLASLLIFLSVYLAAFMALVVFSTGVICLKKDKDSDEDARELYSSNSSDSAPPKQSNSGSQEVYNPGPGGGDNQRGNAGQGQEQGQGEAYNNNQYNQNKEAQSDNYNQNNYNQNNYDQNNYNQNNYNQGYDQ